MSLFQTWQVFSFYTKFEKIRTKKSQPILGFSIWMFCKLTEYESGKETKSMCTNTMGNYQRYLHEIGKKNPSIAKYAENINMSGDFNWMDIHYWEVINNKKHFDLNNLNIQLILAIHYLSLNGQGKRNEKWVAE